MIRTLPDRLLGTSGDEASAVVVVTPDDRDRPLVRTALALATGLGFRVRAFALRDRFAELPAPLRLALHGVGARTEADHAIRHLVDEAVGGAHVPVRPLADPDGSDAAARLGAFGPQSVLVTGHVRGGDRPAPEALGRLLAAHPGAAVILVDHPTVPFEEVLAITPPDGSDAVEDFKRIAWALERSYPVYWRHGVTTPDSLDVAARDCTPETLALLGPTSSTSLGPVQEWAGRMQKLSVGPIAVVLPASPGRAALAVRLLLG